MTTTTPIPLWVLLGFAGWTLVVLLGSIGIYRWRMILTGRATIAEWRADTAQGSERYQRAMRAHMNCVENLPIYGAVAIIAAVAGVGGRDLDALAVVYLVARVGQSLVHIARAQTEPVAALRFGLFFAQIACVVWMGILILLRA